MSKENFKLKRAPIVEAVVDIDCDLPPGFNLGSIHPEASSEFSSTYPNASFQWMEEHSSDEFPDATSLNHPPDLQALQYLSDDEKQIVQMRRNGFTFNRLAPYGSFDDYVPAIHDAWTRYGRLAKPVQVRGLSLRYINHIIIPASQIDLEDYFTVGSREPWGSEALVAEFLVHYVARDVASGYMFRLVLQSLPVQPVSLGVVLDVEVRADKTYSPDNWNDIRHELGAMRVLKNKLFKESLTKKCLQLFQD